MKEITDEGGEGGGDGEKERPVGQGFKSNIPCLMTGVQFRDWVRSGGVRPLLGGAGGVTLDSRVSR